MTSCDWQQVTDGHIRARLKLQAQHIVPRGELEQFIDIAKQRDLPQGRMAALRSLAPVFSL